MEVNGDLKQSKWQNFYFWVNGPFKGLNVQIPFKDF